MRRALLPFVLLLAGCVAAPKRPVAPAADPLAAQAAREAELAQRSDWHLTGRIAVSDGRDGGSGRIEWIQRGARYEIRVNAPVTRRSWRLVGEPGHARLEGLDGGPFVSDSAEDLLHDHLAWDVPLGDLAAWARGMRASGEAVIRFAPTGLPERMQQGGWLIEYRSFDQARQPALPTRVFASRGAHRVRLQVDAWSFDPESP